MGNNLVITSFNIEVIWESDFLITVINSINNCDQNRYYKNYRTYNF